MRTIIICLSLISFVACASKFTPRERYVKALNHKLDGNAKAYYDNLLALALEEPNSRAGRRARATMQGGDPLVAVAILGIVSAIAIPNFLKFQSRAKQSEAKTNLKSLFVALKSYYAETGRFCSSFKQCGFQPEPGAKYYYFLSDKEIAGGDKAKDPERLLIEARTALKNKSITPNIFKHKFLIVAVGNVDSDPTLDIWTIDQDNRLDNVQNDVN